MNTQSENNDFMEDEEFDRLLEEFLSENKEDDDTSSSSSYVNTTNRAFCELDRPELRSCQYKGFTYWIPVFSQFPRCTVSYMELEYDVSCMNLYSVYPRFYYTSEDGSTDVFGIFFQGVTYKAEPDVRVWLYREGNARPLSSCKIPNIHQGDLLLDLKERTTALQPGSYFLLFENLEPEEDAWRYKKRLGGHFIYEFRVLPEGTDSLCPALRHLDVTMEGISSYKGARYRSGMLSLTPHFAEPLGENDEVIFYCFTSSYLYMGCGISELPSSYIWTSGTYLMVAEYNNLPYACMRVTFDGHCFVSGEPYALTPSCGEWHLLRQWKSSKPDDCWQRLCIAPYAAQWICRLFDSFQNQWFDDRRSIWHLKSLPFYEHFLFATDNYRDVESFIRMAIPRCSDIQTVNVATYIETQQRQVQIDSFNELLEGCWHRTVILYNIGVLSTGEGQSFVSRILDKLASQPEWSLCLCGSYHQLQSLLETVPALQPYFPQANRLQEGEPSASQLVHYAQYKLKHSDFTLSSAAEHRLAECFIQAVGTGGLKSWRMREVDDYLMKRVMGHCRTRLLPSPSKTKKEAFTTLLASDIVPVLQNVESTPSFEQCMEGLNQLTGLGSLKEQLLVTFQRVRFDQQRCLAGLHVEGTALSHLVFTGNPGTGKTTVARLMGKACRSLGLLSKGEVVVTERSRLVGRYLGDTEQNTLAVLQAAQGNILFIDEAYNLYTGGKDNRDFGMRVIDTLLTALAAPNPDMLVILAGYESEMERLLTSNPGLKSRFSRILHFEDYSADELMQIALNRINSLEYRLTEKAKDILQKFVYDTVSAKDRYFGNARWVLRLVDEGILSALANRVMGEKTAPTVRELQTIEPSDIRNACKLIVSEKSGLRPRPIGFKA